MNPMIPRARLLMLCGSVVIFCGGLIFALARWNQASTDRAFVEAAALAARQPAAAAPATARFWAPASGAQPGATVVSRVAAVEQARTRPAAAPPAAPADKPPAAPR